MTEDKYTHFELVLHRLKILLEKLSKAREQCKELCFSEDSTSAAVLNIQQMIEKMIIEDIPLAKSLDDSEHTVEWVGVVRELGRLTIDERSAVEKVNEKINNTAKAIAPWLIEQHKQTLSEANLFNDEIERLLEYNEKLERLVLAADVYRTGIRNALTRAGVPEAEPYPPEHNLANDICGRTIPDYERIERLHAQVEQKKITS